MKFLKAIFLMTILALATHAAVGPAAPLMGIPTISNGYAGPNSSTYTLVDPFNTAASLILQNLTVTSSLTVTGLVNEPVQSTTTFTGYITLGNVSQSALGTTTPLVGGQVIYCGTCLQTPLCISSGTTIGAWVAVAASTATSGLTTCK
jgi:hypothetical protein